jgi:TonB-linked SusC/RagA family outer membrane protein
MQNFTIHCVPPPIYRIGKILLIMKIICFLICLSFVTLASPVKSQYTRMSIKVKEVPINKLLKEISRKTTYNFIYNSSVFPSLRKVSISAENETVAAILEQSLKSTGFTFKMLTEKLIVISAEEAADREIVIRGIITDEAGVPLPGVTISLKGLRGSIASTNSKGEFSVQVPDSRAVLTLSYIGFVTQEVSIEGRSAFTIKMQQAYGSLDEVVVVGYGQQNKSTLTQSVSAISGRELSNVPAPNVTQMLAGRLPGLISVSSSGRPGADNASLLIRGLSSTGDNSPLIVIDGIPRSNFNGNGSVYQTVNSLSYMDPNDIESISVLKDAAATSVYGARAANGAILVTTKRGGEGPASVTYSGNVGTQEAVRLVKPLDSYQSALIWNQAWKNEGTFAPSATGLRGYSDEAMEAIRTGSNPDRYSNTDWMGAILGGNAVQTSHNLSISGSTPKNKYFISAGYFNQKGIYKGVGLKRYNVRTNLDGKISNRLEYTLNIAGRMEKKPSTPANPLAAFLIPSLIPYRFTNGNYNFVASGFAYGNPYLDAEGAGGSVNSNADYFESSGTLSYKVPGIEGLTAKGTMAFDRYFQTVKSFRTPYVSYVINDDGTFTIPPNVAMDMASVSQAWSHFQSLTYEASLNYNRSFGNHNLSALLLYTQTQNQGENMSGYRGNLPSAALGELSLGSTVGQSTEGSSFNNARNGLVGRLGYNYNNKYLAELSFRNDGSDLFPPSRRYGFFPAVSAGWKLSEEAFVKQALPFVTNLKLRGSWGQAGNDRAAAFQYLTNYYISTTSGYGFGGTAGTPGQILAPGGIANPSFTWEKATTTNIGLDAGLWNNLLGITVDWFNKRTSNVLASNSSAVPVIIGGTLPVGNYGIVQNRGFEIELSHQNKIGEISYFVRPNITFNRSKVIYYPDAASTPAALKLTGKPVSPDAVTGYVANGFYQSQEEITSGPTPLYPNVQPGDFKYQDTNNDGKITADDMVIISRGSTPGIMLGLHGGLTYKNFDVDFLFQGAADVRTYISSYMSTSFSVFTPTAYALQQDYWTPENPGATFPRPTLSSFNNKFPNSYWVRNSKYVRLKNLSIGYTIPAALSKKMGISNIKVFLSGTNLFTLSPVKDIADPENSLSVYPIVKVYNIGLNVKF